MTPEEVLSHATTPCVSCLALGRETVGFPKKLGSPRLYHDIDTLVGTLDYGSLRIATATMGFKHTPLDTEDARTDAAVPLCIVKIGHSFDGTVHRMPPGPAAFQGPHGHGRVVRSGPLAAVRPCPGSDRRSAHEGNRLRPSHPADRNAVRASHSRPRLPRVTRAAAVRW
ncbi:hypothetical protein GCM10020221_20090 [Streptomyces thioluteus]|uniref:Uncharacterized protein n=1 Tax=Streptomyces thioluteus TaxID=66431 RepID=A0ABN3WQA2_STRTU